MRKNPYNRNITKHIPLAMQGPTTTNLLTTTDAQKVFLKKNMQLPPLHKYEVESRSSTVSDASFNMVRPPTLNQYGVITPPNILNMEMGQMEVTQELFEAVMGPEWNRSKNHHFFEKSSGNIQNPVENITWYECIAFCNELSKRLNIKPCYTMTNIRRPGPYAGIEDADVKWDEDVDGFRLPTREEWVAFAMSGTSKAWAGCDTFIDLKDYAWFNLNSGRKTHPVGQKNPNQWGLYDMCGNVSEWSWDREDSALPIYKKLCGGDFSQNGVRLRLDVHGTGYALAGDHHVGFRICRTIK